MSKKGGKMTQTEASRESHHELPSTRRAKRSLSIRLKFTYKNFKRYFAASLPVATFEEPAVRAAWSSSTHGGDQRCERRRWG